MHQATVRPHPISTRTPSLSKLGEVIESKSRKQNFSGNVHELYIFIFFILSCFFFRWWKNSKALVSLALRCSNWGNMFSNFVNVWSKISWLILFIMKFLRFWWTRSAKSANCHEILNWVNYNLLVSVHVVQGVYVRYWRILSLLLFTDHLERPSQSCTIVCELDVAT